MVAVEVSFSFPPFRCLHDGSKIPFLPPAFWRKLGWPPAEGKKGGDTFFSRLMTSLSSSFCPNKVDR